jgi:hypothetical protein
VPADEYQEFERFRAQRRSFATVDLAEDKVRAVAAARMDSCHDHLNALLASAGTSKKWVKLSSQPPLRTATSRPRRARARPGR